MKYKIGIIGATQLVESSKMKGKSSQFCTITKKWMVGFFQDLCLTPLPKSIWETNTSRKMVLGAFLFKSSYNICALLG